MLETIVGGLLNIGGGLLGDRSNRKIAAQNQALTREQMAMQRHQFNQQMDASIQRRVADARAAGVHPLFALGASVGASPTASIGGGQPATGSAVGKALQGIGADIARGTLRQANAAALRDETEAAYIDSKRKREEQEFQGRGHDGASRVTTYPYPGGPEADNIRWGPAQYVKPERPQMARPGVEGGIQAEMMRVQFQDGHEILVPSKEVSDELREWEYYGKRILHKYSHKPVFSIKDSEGNIVWQWPGKHRNPK